MTGQAKMSKRLLPLFLLRGGRLWKGTQFEDYVDVGHPVSQAMVFDAQGAEEIAVVDITATRENRMIDPAVITAMIQKCKLPIAAGGGIRTVEDAQRCFDAGADKIIVNTHAVQTPELIRRLAQEYGSQAVLVSLDVRRQPGGGWEVYTRGGTCKTGLGVEQAVEQVLAAGAGELMVTSIEREGTLLGMDVALYERLRPLVPVPLIASGGAGKYDDIVEMFQRSDADACALGKILFLRDYDIVRIKSYLTNQKVPVRDA